MQQELQLDQVLADMIYEVSVKPSIQAEKDSVKSTKDTIKDLIKTIDEKITSVEDPLTGASKEVLMKKKEILQQLLYTTGLPSNPLLNMDTDGLISVDPAERTAERNIG